MPPIIHIEETKSTNSHLKQLLLKKELEEATIVVTNHQTEGRGQRGNGWESEKGKNLTFSMILYPTIIPIDKQFILSQIVSLAIKEILDEYTSDITIKWPNDIYWREKKICGILIENTLSEQKIENCIIGIGININQETFKTNPPNPISLREITNKEYNLTEILTNLQNKILDHYQLLQKGEITNIQKQYKNSLFRKNGYYSYHDGVSQFEAKIKDIESNGAFILQTRDGIDRRFLFKEVRYLL